MGLLGEAGMVGLELDTGTIRGVELKGKNGKVRIAAAGQVAIPEGAVVEGVIHDEKAVSDALDRLWLEARFGSRQVVLGAFNQGVMMRLVTFPKVPREKLEPALRLQAGDYFPIPMSQLVLDMAVVGEVQSEAGPQYEVLLVAARKAHLEKCLQVMRESRLKVQVIDASPLALMRALPKDMLAGTVALVDLAIGVSSLLVIVDGVPRYARVLPVSLQRYLAELKPPADAQEGGAYAASWERFGRSVAGEIRSSVSFFVRQDSLSDLDRVVLSGSGAQTAGLAGVLSDELGVAVNVADPLARVKAPGDLGIDWAQEGAAFMVCIGLALRGMEVGA